MPKRKLAKPAQPGHLAQYGLIHTDKGRIHGLVKARRKAASKFDNVATPPLNWKEPE